MQPSIPPLASSASGPRVAGSSLRHLWFLLAFYGLAFVWGIRHVHFWETSALDFVVPVAISITLGSWAVADARARHHPIPMLARPWFFILAPLLVPGYVIWSRRGWGVALIILHVIAWYGLATVAMHVGGVIVFGASWLQAMR